VTAPAPSPVRDILLLQPLRCCHSPHPLNCPSRPTLDCDLALHPRRTFPCQQRGAQLFFPRRHERRLLAWCCWPWTLRNSSQTTRKRDWNSSSTNPKPQCGLRPGIAHLALAPVDLVLRPLLEIGRGSSGTSRQHGAHEPRSPQNLVRLRTAHRAGSLVAAPPAALKYRAGLPRAATGRRPRITAHKRLVLLYRCACGLPAPECTATAPGIPASAATAASSAGILPS
jgi:hypothetical protein